MKTLEEIRDEAITRARKAYDMKLDHINRTVDELGHVLMWFQENVDESRITSPGFDYFGFRSITINIETVREAESLMTRMIRECNVRVVDYPDTSNPDSTSLEWIVRAKDASTSIRITFHPTSCRLVETGEYKQVPIRKIVCEGADSE